MIFEEADIASLPPPPSPQEEGTIEEREVTTPTASASSMMHLNLNVTKIFRRKKKKRQDPGKVFMLICIWIRPGIVYPHFGSVRYVYFIYNN